MSDMISALQGEELTRRLNTIATNAVREAQIAIGRGDRPWVDDDWRRSNMIAQILNLVPLRDVDLLREHYPLTAPVQAPKNDRLDNIERKLADALMAVDAEISEESSAAVKREGPAFKIPEPKKTV